MEKRGDCGDGMCSERGGSVIIRIAPCVLLKGRA